MKEGVCLDTRDFFRSALVATSGFAEGYRAGLEAPRATGLLGDSLLEKELSGVLLGSTSCALEARVVLMVSSYIYE